ncbi:hypothetical protein [Actinoplanes aureus]|uniref:Uncharacterized protein n=1 Tax=Actinoplanes aureus TaxID=2792083 RepID=A0A931CKQ5_9ACTN|nr:hypothetical protein [Actinoplanes aureus]MBG0568821.1 hypothetical protein [Actinoplanes aureus]
MRRTAGWRIPAVRVVSFTALFGVLLAGLAALGTGGPASASVSKHHGKWMSKVSGCKHNYRIGRTARLVAENGADYGWVEWRASRTGACAGYQWVRMHFSRNLGFTTHEPNYKSWQIYYKRDPWGRPGVDTRHQYNLKVGGLRYFKKGAYNSRIFYAPNEKACAQLFTYANRWDLGLNIQGQGDLLRLTYCA